jgi:hypothetical protein
MGEVTHPFRMLRDLQGVEVGVPLQQLKVKRLRATHKPLQRPQAAVGQASLFFG